MELIADRTLALKLHALHEEDVKWILDRIDIKSREKIRDLLDELKQLGFLVDSELIREAGKCADQTGHVRNTNGNVVSAIDAVRPDFVRRVLDGEPHAIRRYIMEIRSWRWLPGMDFSQSDRLDPVRSRGKPTLRVQQALLNALSARLASESGVGGESLSAECRPTSVRDANISRWQQWLNRVMPWRC